MEQTTARDFLIHLKQGNYQGALDVANELDLDKDIVYKSQWTQRKAERGTSLTHEDIEILELIQDSAWLLSECLDTLIEGPEVQKELLLIGKKRVFTITDPIINDRLGSLTTTDKTWLRTRLYIMEYLDRLHTYIKIWPSYSSSASFATYYGQFRDSHLVAQAIEFARCENHVALDAIFMHHGREVLPYRLFILSQIPETADPSRFDLPHVTHDHEDRWLEEPWSKDRVQEDRIKKLIQLDVPELSTYLTRLESGIEKTDYPTTSDVIAKWYRQRAEATDKIGLSSQALEISRYAQVMGVTGIESLITDYEWLCKYIYASSDHVDEVVDLDKFLKMSNYEILQGLLSHTTTASVVDDVRRLALPWVELCRKKTSEDHMSLLYQWLFTISVDHLEWCCNIIEMSKPTLSPEDRIITDDIDLSRIVLSIAYTVNGSTEYLIRMFECLPIFPELGADSDKIVEIASISPLPNHPRDLYKELQSVGPYGLTQMMDLFQNHLSSAEILSRYNASIPLPWFLVDQPIESQRQLCIRMASQAAGGVESGGEKFDHDDDWRELLDDMIRLNEDDSGVFDKLDSLEILEIFFSSLLRCGRFKLAKELILGSKKIMDINKAEKLVIDAEREFFDNATSGNKNVGRMKQAWDCLHILPPTADIKKEMDLIEATHLLISEYRVQDRPGYTLMPIQVRQCKDRLEFIPKLINARREIYRRHDDVLELVRKLGFQDNLLAKVKALSMLAGAALVDEDYLESYKLCQITVEAAQNKSSIHSDENNEIDQCAFQICLNLGKMDSFNDISRRLDVLSMAMSLCPVENIRDVLTVWRKLDKQNPDPIDLAQLNAQSLNKHMAGSNSWQGLLHNATKQWKIGELLTGGEAADGNNKRKRDIVRNVVGGWLFQ
ncbi:secretory pathway protein Sec39-domain-containing protein [Pilobolus umbonatus]|nr:secretory pathway protein Sec39-domain-containing protein [Pilobolus umbonatus]